MPNTPNHNANLPTVGADDSTWGTENNGTHNFWDALLSGPQFSFLGRILSGPGPMKQLSQAEATSALAAMIGDSGTGGTKGLVPAPAAGDAAGAKVLTADGTWKSPAAAIGRFVGSTGATVVARGISLSRSATGTYTATLSPAMADTNYIIDVIPEDDTLAGVRAIITSKTASGFAIEQRTAAAAYDADFLNIIITVV